MRVIISNICNKATRATAGRTRNWLRGCTASWLCHVTTRTRTVAGSLPPVITFIINNNNIIIIIFFINFLESMQVSVGRTIELNNSLSLSISLFLSILSISSAGRGTAIPILNHFYYFPINFLMNYYYYMILYILFYIILYYFYY